MNATVCISPALWQTLKLPAHLTASCSAGCERQRCNSLAIWWTSCSIADSSCCTREKNKKKMCQTPPYSFIFLSHRIKEKEKKIRVRPFATAVWVLVCCVATVNKDLQGRVISLILGNKKHLVFGSIICCDTAEKKKLTSHFFCSLLAEKCVRKAEKSGHFSLKMCVN